MAGTNFMTGYDPYMVPNFGMNYNNYSSGFPPMFRSDDYYTLNPNLISNYTMPNSVFTPTPWPTNGDSFGPNVTPMPAPKPVAPVAGGKNDAKLSFWDKVKNFGKGLISPITNMFSSPGNFLKGAAMIVGGAALIAITGGAAAPIMVAAGVTMGAYNIGKGAINAMNATTREEAEAAWQQMGGGTAAVGLSVLGAKSALKASGTTPTGGFINSTVQCFKATPGAFGRSFANARTFFTATGTGGTTTSGPKPTNEPPRGSTNEPPPKSPTSEPSRPELPSSIEQSFKGYTESSVKQTLSDAFKTGGEASLKKAYRNLARNFHPDSNPGSSTAEAFFKFTNNLNDALLKGESIEKIKF